MRTKRISASDPRMKKAISELKTAILSRYPDATFKVERGEDPDGIYIITTVDLEDGTQVFDVIGERLVDMRVDEGLPIHVIPVQPHGWRPEQARSQT